MRKCPWCGRENLNVYSYCQSCGRGFDDPDPTGDGAKRGRSFLMMSVVATAALAVVAIASAALILMGGEDSAPVAAGGGAGPQPTEPAGPFDGILVEQNILFVTTEFTLPPETEVTLVEDNQDAQIPHNIRFFAGAETGGETLGGCIEGCDGDELVTPLRAGVTRNTFTFTTPAVGTYAFHCDVHPTTMMGTMIIEQGAPVPDVAQ